MAGFKNIARTQTTAIANSKIRIATQVNSFGVTAGCVAHTPHSSRTVRTAIMRRFASSFAVAVASSLVVCHPAALAFVPSLTQQSRTSNAAVVRMQRQDEISREVAKVVAASMLTAALLMTPPVLAATTNTPPSLVAPILPTSKTLVTSAKSAPRVPAEKKQLDDAVNALKDASLKLVSINKDLAVAKSASQRACLCVDQAEAKANAAKDDLAKLKVKNADAAKIGMCLSMFFLLLSGDFVFGEQILHVDSQFGGLRLPCQQSFDNVLSLHHVQHKPRRQ